MADTYTRLQEQDRESPQPATLSTFDRLQAQDREDARLRTSVDAALQTTPEAAARVKYLSNVTGIAPSVIATQEGEVKARAKFQEIQKEAQFSPILQARLRDPEFTKLAIDDVPTLSKIEQGIGSVMQFVMGADGKGGLPGMVERGAQKSYYGGVKGTSGVFQAASELVAPLLDPLENVQSIGGNPLRRLAEGFGLIGSNADAKSDAIKSPYDGNIAAGAESGFTSLGQNAKYLPLTLAGPAGVAAALIGMSLETGGQSYQEARAKGVGQNAALAYGASDAVIEFATEKIPMHRLIGDVAANTNIFKTIAKQIGLEVPGEQIATALQDLNEWAVMHPEKTFGDYIAARPDAAVQTLVATVIGTGGNVAVNKALGTLMDAQVQKEYNDLFNAQRDAQDRAAKLQDVMATAAGSKLRELSPETFREHVQAAADGQDGAPKSVHIDGQVLLQTLQAAGVTEEQLAQTMPSVVSQLADAAASNSTVEIPIGELATALPGTPLEQAILPHLRIGGPESLSQAEAEQAQEQAQEYLKGEADRVMQESQDQAQWSAESETVRAGIKTQLDATGRFSSDVTAKYAKLVQEFYSVMASRTGMTPAKLYEMLPYKVGATAQQGGAVLDTVNQDAAMRDQGGQLVTESDAFKNWFGDWADPLAFSSKREKGKTPVSMAVNEDGTPMVMYHATNGNFTAFEAGRATTNETTFGPMDTERHGIFVSPSVGFSEEYLRGGEGANVMPIYVNVKAPADLTEGLPGDVITDIVDNSDLNRADFYGIQRGNEWEIFDGDFGKKVVAALKAAGYDGAILTELDRARETEHQTWVAFDPTQIKSVFNRGTFDPNDANILNQSMSTRLPTAKKALENPLETMLIVGLASSKADPVAFEKNVGLIRAYVNFRDNKSASTPDKAAEQFIQHVVDNLLWLHDQVPEATRQRSKLWYDGARNIVDQWTAKYGVTDAQAAGMLAVLSPQKDWFQNVSLAERVLDVMTTKQDFTWSDEMSATAAELSAIGVEDRGELTGKKLGEIDNPVMQAMWVRVYDQTYHERGYRVVSPEGNFESWVVNADGQTKSKTAWGSFNEIGKAISIFKDGSVANISASLGEQHKVRNFYNNIFDPASVHGDVTIDTHAVAAGLLRPLSGSSLEVAHNFGAGTANSGVFGSKGTYGIYAEAYRRAAEKRGILAREMQSITWEAVRGLYTAGFKSQAANVAAVDAVWADYKKRKVSLDDTRKRITELAGGIAAPEWERSGTGSPQEAWASSYTGELRTPGGAAGATATGARSGTTQGTGELNEYNQSATGNGGGRYSSGGLAPLEGAPSIRGATGPDPVLVAVAEQYAKSIGVDLKRQYRYVGVDPERAARIAAAYDAMPHAPNDPAVKEAFENLIRQTVAQYRALEAAGYKFWFIDPNADVYEGNPWNAMRDLRANQSMGVFPTESGFGSGATELDTSNNPLMADTGIEWGFGNADGPKQRVLANDLFRAVHDAFGHGLEGAGFRAEGEENAWQAHVRLFTGSAVGAITSETRGQNSWLNYGPYGEQNRSAKVEDTVFADQKTGLMPEWTWTEGRVEDMDDGTQAEQRRIRQVMDLAVLQQGENKTLSQDSNGRVDLTGVHFSRETRVVLDGRKYGTGLKGIERERIFNGTDQRLRERVMFYIDEGKGVRPEAGVGGAAHSVELANLYDIKADPLGLVVGGNLNQTESNVLDAGFNGYYVRDAFNQQGAAVVIGDASRGMTATPIANPTTKAPPLPVAPQTYKRGLTSAELNTLDIAKIQAAAPTARVRSGTFMVDGSELKAASDAMAAQGITLPPTTYAQEEPKPQGPRGTFNPETLTTVLNESADLSTFLHETGHFFLEAMAALASSEGADPSVTKDMEKLLQWFGVKDLDTWNAMTLNEKRPHHERFAESFEQYLLEGKAPNTELSSLFRTFRAWLTRVYRSLKEFTNGRDLQLSDDIRKVMDRMVASEEQIAEAEKVAGLVPNLDATGEAIEKLQSRSIRDLKWAVNARNKFIKQMQQEAKAKRKEVEEEVTAEVDAAPEMRAKKALDALRVDPDYTVALKQWNENREEQRKQSQEKLESELRAANPDVKGLAKGQLMAKNKRAIANQAEALTLEWEKQNPKPKRPVNMTDADVATVADSFGFESPEKMVAAIDAYGDRDTAIEGITDQRMLERYGDLVDQQSIEQAATEAVHNAARAKSLATELAAQRELLNPRQDTGKTNTRGNKLTVNALAEAAKQFAANVIGRKAVSDLKKAAYNHLQAERRAAKAWEAATAKGDTKAAVQAKQDQMLNHAAVRAANEALADAKKTMEFFAKVLKGNSETVVENGRDADIVNAARAILAVYGVGAFKGKNAFKYMDLLKANDPNLFAILDDSVRAAVASAKPVGKMTVDELTALRDEIASMWHLAKSSRQYEVDGDRMDIEDAAEELKVRMDAKGVPATMPGDSGAVTEAEKRGRSLQFAGALLRRVESWAEAMDGKFGGPFLKLVFQPVKAAADRYRADRAAYRKQFTALVENVAPQIKPGVIEAPELGYTFGKGKGGVGQAELLSAILHLGNESNKRKLLLGRNWATENEDGTLDTSRWDRFMERMHNTGVINKAHYDFAQGVWDLLEKMKPLAQKTHRDVYGRYFAEVTANSFEVPGIGFYRGGYVPAQVDPEIVKDNEMRKLAEVENENMSYAFPATNKGFTKSRTEYNRPLMLDLRTLPQHIDKVLLFSHMEPAVRGVSKVLGQKGVASMLGKIDPAAISGMLTPWLNRSARQIVETPVVGDGRISRVLSVVRSRAGMSVMFGNLSNTVQQLAGLTLARVKIKSGYLMPAMAQYARNPKKMSEAVAAASSFMATRMDDQVAALNGTVEEILLNPSVYEKAQNWTAKHTYFLQSALDNVVGPVVWSAAYNQALADGMSEQDAVHFADGTVRQTQGSTLPEDVSRIETGPAYARMFTQFIGYFNMVANTNVTALQNIADDVGLKKGAGKALAVVFFGLLAPAWIAEAIAVGFKGGPDDENKDGSYLADWLLAVFGMGTLKTVLAGVPFVGQFAMAGLNTWNGKPYDDRTNLSPAVSMLEGAVGAPHSVYKALVENGSKQKAVRDVATAVSLVTGLPVSAAARPLGYLTGVAENKVSPTGPVDAARGVLTGAASPESKR